MSFKIGTELNRLCCGDALFKSYKQRVEMVAGVKRIVKLVLSEIHFLNCVIFFPPYALQYETICNLKVAGICSIQSIL